MMVKVTELTSIDTLVSAFVVTSFKLGDATMQRVTIVCGLE